MGQTRVVLVPAESQGTPPICSGQGATQYGACDDDPSQFWHRPEAGAGPIPTEGAKVNHSPQRPVELFVHFNLTCRARVQSFPQLPHCWNSLQMRQSPRFLVLPWVWLRQWVRSSMVVLMLVPPRRVPNRFQRTLKFCQHTTLDALCSHAWRVLQQKSPSTCCVITHPQQSPRSGTVTRKPKIPVGGIVDALEFDLTRGDSDEELVPLDSPGSEVEFEESVAGEEKAAPVSEEEFPDVPDVRAAVLRAAFRTLDDVDPCHQFRQRAAVMKCVPKFLQGLFRNALKVALKEIIDGAGEVEQERGWKRLLMLPRMLLHRPPGGSKVSKSKLRARFESFSRGDWINLIVASEQCDERAAISRSRSNRRAHDDLESRAAIAEMLVSSGELSSARQAIEGARLLPESRPL